MSQPRASRWAGLLAGLSCLVGGHAEGQEEPRGGFVEQLEVVEVLLDVLVTDKRGQVILGLGPGDFDVEENGRPVELTSVTFYSSAELLGSLEALERRGMSVDEIPQERFFVILFDQQRQAASQIPGLLGRQREAARDLERWISEDLQPQDWVAVASYETRLAIVQDFSRNLEELRQAFEHGGRGRGSSRDWPSRQPEIGDGPSLLRNMPRGEDLGRQTKDIYGALQVLARAAGFVRGRKNLILVGRGIGEMNRFGIWEPDSRFFSPTVEALNDNNVAVYPLNLVPHGTWHSLEQSLFKLANDTGGAYSRLFTSFSTPLHQISAENSGYYLLSYEGRHETGDRRFQQVSVRTRNPELRVRARRGYLTGE